MAMTPFRVVEHLNVVEDIRSGLFAGGIDATTNPFALEQLEEAFGHGIVMAITPAAHTGHESMGLEEVAPVVAAELAALIAMDDDLILRTATPDGRQQGVEHQIRVDAAPHGPAHHGAGKEVQHHGQIQPSLMGADVGDVGHPGLIGRGHIELLLQGSRLPGWGARPGYQADVCNPFGSAVDSRASAAPPGACHRSRPDLVGRGLPCDNRRLDRCRASSG